MRKARGLLMSPNNNNSDLATSTIFDMKSMLKKINIDCDEWVGKSAKEKINYIRKKLRSEDRLNLIDTGSKLADMFFGTLRRSVGNRVFQSYVGVAETAFNLFRINFVVKNAFVAEQYIYSGVYDELAHDLGCENDTEIQRNSMHASVDMCRHLVTISPELQNKYDLKVVSMRDILDHDSDDDDALSMRTVMVVEHAGKQYGLQVEAFKENFTDDDPDAGNGSAYSSLILADAFCASDEEYSGVTSAIYSSYLSTIDISKYYFVIDKSFFLKRRRVDVNFEMRNLDVEYVRKAIERTFAIGGSRGYFIEGEAGTGKTESVHKILSQFPEVPVFWVPQYSLGIDCISYTFEMLGHVDHSIIVMDDVDGLRMEKKDALASEFIRLMDNLREKGSHIVIMIANEPQCIHHTIRNRPGRIDEIIVVRPPDTKEGVLDVILQRYIHMGKPMPEWMTFDSEVFCGICEKLANRNTTQAQITAIVSDYVMFDGDGDGDVNLFSRVVDKRLESIANSSLVADSGGRLCSTETRSD